jgi:ABC-2 type transport system permease protein
VLGLSPFHHLAQVPVDPFAAGPAAVMVAVGVALALCGVVAFERRDLVGA